MASLPADDEDQLAPEIIKVGIFSSNNSTACQLAILPAYPLTKAKEFCVQLATKVDVGHDELKYYNLILVYSKVYENEPQKKIYRIKTLHPEDIIVDVLGNVINRQSKGGYVNGNSNYKFIIRWYYKDYRSKPLYLNDNGDISGNSSSDSDTGMSQDNVRYLTSSMIEDKKGYLYRRSNRDMNIWRKRFAVLVGEKLWLIKSRNGIEKVRCVKITSTTKVHDRIPSHDYPFCFLVNENNKLHYFRAASDSDQVAWKEQIYSCIKLYRDSDCIKIAEMIITDEESARSYRLQKSLTNMLHQDGVMHALGSSSSSNSYSDSNSVNNGLMHNQLYEFDQRTNQQIVKSIHRASRGESIVHNIHSKETVIADAMAFLLAVQRYKELHRHDLKVSLNRLWSFTLHLFQAHLSGHLIGLGVVVSQENALEFPDDYDSSRGNRLFWTVNMDTLTRIHQSIFSNLRKYEGNASGTSPRGSAKQRNRPSSMNKESDSSVSSFWSKAFTFSSSNDSSKERGRAASDDENDEQGLFVYNINRTCQYRIIDPSKRPSTNLFDELVAETEHKMSSLLL